jgi:hypothetical protein
MLLFEGRLSPSVDVQKECQPQSGWRRQVLRAESRELSSDRFWCLISLACNAARKRGQEHYNNKINNEPLLLPGANFKIYANVSQFDSVRVEKTKNLDNV